MDNNTNHALELRDEDLNQVAGGKYSYTGPALICQHCYKPFYPGSERQETTSSCPKCDRHYNGTGN